MNLLERVKSLEEKNELLMEINQNLPREEKHRHGFGLILDMQQEIRWIIQDITRLF